MIIEQCPVDSNAAEDRRLIERISMLLAGGTFTFLIEDSDRRRVKSWTPTVTGNVHHAEYQNLFPRNQTSRSRAPRSYRARTRNDIFVESAHDRESNIESKRDRSSLSCHTYRR